MELFRKFTTGSLSKSRNKGLLQQKGQNKQGIYLAEYKQKTDLYTIHVY